MTWSPFLDLPLDPHAWPVVGSKVPARAGLDRRQMARGGLGSALARLDARGGPFSAPQVPASRRTRKGPSK